MKKYTLIIITLLFSLNLSAQVNWSGMVGSWQSKDSIGGKKIRFNGTSVKYALSDTLSQFAKKQSVTVSTDFIVNGRNARILVPSTYSATGIPSKLAIYFHFFGGNYTTTPTGVLRDSLINNGYAIVTISAGDTWGNEFSQQLYTDLYRYAINNFNVDNKVLAVSTSMGSLTALNIIKRNLIPIQGLINVIGVVNLKEYYGRAIGFSPESSIESSYGFSNALDSTKAFLGFDPYADLINTFGDTSFVCSAPVYFVNGEIDISVPIKYTRNIYNGLINNKSNSVLNIVAGVGHDTSIVTSAIASDIIKWASSNILRERAINSPDKTLIAKNNIISIDNSVGSNNFTQYKKTDGSNRGYIGFINPDVSGTDAITIYSTRGNIGVLSGSEKDVVLGSVNNSNIVIPALKANKDSTLIYRYLRVNGDINIPSGKNFMINGVPIGGGGGGSVDSVALVLGTTGTDINSSVTTPTTTPILNLNIPTSSATNRGALSSTDWIAFNNKQSAISFAEIGSTPNTNGASISGGVITLQPASVTFGGLITTVAQTFAGNKTFNGTVQSINFGSGIAPNANSRYTASAGTSTIGQFLFTPGVDYTGSVNGMTSYTSTGSRLKMYRSASLDDFIFSGNNTVLAGSGNRIVIADTLGVPTATINYRPYINNVSSASTLTLDDSGVYTFTGTTTIYTLPPISGNTLKEFVIINEGSGNLVINSNAGGNDILDGNTSLNTVTIAAGDNPYTFINNSRKYVIK